MDHSKRQGLTGQVKRFSGDLPRAQVLHWGG